jgi:hypothetical protein
LNCAEWVHNVNKGLRFARANCGHENRIVTSIIIGFDAAVSEMFKSYFMLTWLVAEDFSEIFKEPGKSGL